MSRLVFVLNGPNLNMLALRRVAKLAEVAG